MSNLNQISKTTIQSLFDQFYKRIFHEMIISQPAEIVSYDPETQLADVKLAFIKSIPSYGSVPTLEPTSLSNVPVIQTAGVCGGMIVPIAVGDEGLVVFLDRSKDQWLQGQSPSVPIDQRVHDLNDAIFIPFLHSKDKVLKDVDNISTTIRYVAVDSDVINNQIKLTETQTKMNIADDNGTFVMKNGQVSFSQSTIDTFNKLITTLNDVKSALTATSNKTLQVPAGALVAPNGPVTGSTTTQTPDLTSNINSITQDIQNLQDSFNNGFKKLFTD